MIFRSQSWFSAFKFNVYYYFWVVFVMGIVNVILQMQKVLYLLSWKFSLVWVYFKEIWNFWRVGVLFSVQYRVQYGVSGWQCVLSEYMIEEGGFLYGFFYGLLQLGGQEVWVFFGGLMWVVFFQVLDVWVIGVMLYCFVYGKVSVRWVGRAELG